MADPLPTPFSVGSRVQLHGDETGMLLEVTPTGLDPFGNPCNVWRVEVDQRPGLPCYRCEWEMALIEPEPPQSEP